MNRDARAWIPGSGWRAASLIALLAAVLCAFAMREWRGIDRHGDYVTGFAGVFALLAAQAITCGAGILFGLAEAIGPAEHRDRWSGVALWANVLFAMIAVAMLLA
jgi:hypothetical protein